jgi:hypothetical protein
MAAAAGSAGAAAASAAAVPRPDADAESAHTISFRALQRCRTTMEDFASTYFPLHGLSLPRDLFRFLDVLLYVEATIYQAGALHYREAAALLLCLPLHRPLLPPHLFCISRD